MTARVVVYTKPGCHLCEDACTEVARIVGDLGVDWEPLDISGDEQLMREWGEYIPVIVVDGQVHGWFRVNEDRLRAALA
jgi:glutaredoxin